MDRRRRRRRDRWVGTLALAALIIVTAIAVPVVGALTPSSSRAGASAADPGSGPPPVTARGAARPLPWPAPASDRVSERAALADLKLGPPGERMHIHAHLTVTVHGQPVTVPKHLGITREHGRAVYSPLHTHDTTGIVHVESDVRRDFTLAQVFTEWDVALGEGTVGAYGPATGDTVVVFANGEPIEGDPAAHVLKNLENLDVVVVPAGETPVPPPGFYWPSNY